MTRKNILSFIVTLTCGAALLITVNSYAQSPEGDEKKGTALNPTNLYGADEKGMFYSDPVTWIRNNYNILIFDSTYSIRAQVFDQNGYTMNETIHYDVPGRFRQRGNMVLFNSVYKCQRATVERPRAIFNSANRINIQAGGVRQTIIVHVAPIRCDSFECHPLNPPRHVLEKKSNDGVQSRCDRCHDLAIKIHPLHYKKVANDGTGCFKCHPQSGCQIGLNFEDAYNPHRNKTCIDCHGTLYDSVNGSFRAKGQRGLPRCSNCHGEEYAYLKENTFKDAYGHGGVACINCHSSTYLGNHTTIGYNSCATACHTTQPSDNKMGPDCGRCHNSSVAPHQVKRNI
ncbi:MAG: hypothetical protein ACMUJM_20225 [bacterium]